MITSVFRFNFWQWQHVSSERAQKNYEKKLVSEDHGGGCRGGPDTCRTIIDMQITPFPRSDILDFGLEIIILV